MILAGQLVWAKVQVMKQADENENESEMVAEQVLQNCILFP